MCRCWKSSRSISAPKAMPSALPSVCLEYVDDSRASDCRSCGVKNGLSSDMEGSRGAFAATGCKLRRGVAEMRPSHFLEPARMLIVASGATLAQLLGLDPNDSRVEGFRRKEPVRFFRRQRQQNMIPMATKAARPSTTPTMIPILLSLGS